MLSSRHFLSRIVLIAAAALLLGCPVQDRAQAEVEVKNSYTYNATDSPHADPNAFISNATGEIDFEPNATLEAEVDFEEEVWDNWSEWHADGAPAEEAEDYGLEPLSTLTLGSSGYNATLKKGSRVINTGESDAITALGEVDIELKEDSLAHGPWAGIAVENIAQGSLDSSVDNLGRIGTYEHQNGTQIASDFGIWVNEADEEDSFHLRNREEGHIEGDISGVHVVGGPGDIEIVASGNSTIQSEGSGISLGEVDPIAAWAMRPEAYHYFQGDFSLEANATIEGGTTGVDILGEGAKVKITLGEEGTIQGGDTGIRILDQDDGEVIIVNYGEIIGSDEGVHVAGGSVDIKHYGTLEAGVDGDAILLDRGVEEADIELYSDVEGDIRHLGETGDSRLSLMDGEPGEESDFILDRVEFGQGVIEQKGTNATTTWTLGDEVQAGSLLTSSGETKLEDRVLIEEDINATKEAELTVAGSEVTTENLRIGENATLSFDSGTIRIDQGTFDHSNAPLELGSDTHLSLNDAEVLVQENATLTSGSLLSGTGKMEGVLAVREGTLEPGDPVGELEVDGDLQLEDNATMRINIKGGEDNSGRVSVGDDAVIQEDNATLHIREETVGQVRDGDEYTYLTWEDELEGNFTRVVDYEPLYDFIPDYEEDRAYFTAERLTDYSEKAETGNQKSVARALESARQEGHLQDLMSSWEELLIEVKRGDNAQEGMRAALDQMSPEPYQAAFRQTAAQAREMSARTMQSARQSRLKMAAGAESGVEALLESSPRLAGNDPDALGQSLDTISQLGRSVLDLEGSARIARDEMGVSAAGSEWRGFYGLYYREGDMDHAPERTGHSLRSTGLVAGAERNLGDRLTAGASLGYVRSSVDFDRNRGELDTNSFRLGSHATYMRGDLEVDLAASAGMHLHRQERGMTLPKPALATSRYDSYDGSLHAGGRYNWSFADRWALVPSASLQYTYHYREDHTEGRASEANLELDSQSEQFLRSNLEMSLGREFSGEEFVLVPQVFAGGGMNLLEEDMDLEASLAEAPGSDFQVTGEGNGRRSLHYGLGMTALFWDYNVAFLRYERESLEEGGSETFSAGVKWNF